MRTIAIGAAAGGSGDRVDTAAPIVASLKKRGMPAALIFENLAERTLAFAQLAKRRDPESGYEPALDMEVRPVLRDCVDSGIPIISNFGAANPAAAARLIRRIAQEEGVRDIRIAVIIGDDLSDPAQRPLLDAAMLDATGRGKFVTANAYIGARAIADALRAGAHVVVAGRVSDPSLTVGPALAQFDWADDDWDRLAGATMAGHLLECASQVTGGYFADPGFKDVDGLATLGYPIVELADDGTSVVTKPEGSGGLVDVRTVKEQLLYEIHDPAAYLTPDVVADISAATVEQVGPHRVRLSGVRGHPRTPTLKTMAFFEGGWLGEAEISYAGPNAEARARLCMAVLRERMGAAVQLRFDLIGAVSILADDGGTLLDATASRGLTDVRLRAAMRDADEAQIDRLHREMTALWMAGPAGGGGVRVAKRQRLSNIACLVPRERVPTSFFFLD